jgi:hypothetical protein
MQDEEGTVFIWWRNYTRPRTSLASLTKSFIPPSNLHLFVFFAWSFFPFASGFMSYTWELSYPSFTNFNDMNNVATTDPFSSIVSQ